jgi:hypothetical protein
VQPNGLDQSLLTTTIGSKDAERGKGICTGDSHGLGSDGGPLIGARLTCRARRKKRREKSERREKERERWSEELCRGAGQTQQLGSVVALGLP